MAALCWSIREEIPHVQDQGQKPGGPHAQGAAAKRSYPTSEVRGCGREELPHARGAGSYRTPKIRGGGREEQPHIQGAAAAQAKERGNCTSEVRGRGRKEQPHVQEAKAERRYHTF